MNEQDMVSLVARYFAGVDAEDYEAISATLAPDCLFTVETHGVKLQGHREIKDMLERLWSSHASVLHKDFVYTAAPDHNRIAVRFAVVNTHHDGSQTHKSNSNFFEIRDGVFSRISVYMAGENTLDTD